MKEYILLPERISNKLFSNNNGTIEIDGIVYCKINIKDFIGLFEKKIESLQEDINDIYHYLSEYTDDYVSPQKIEEIKQSTAPDNLEIELGRVVFLNIISLDNSAEFDAGTINGIENGKEKLQQLIDDFR